MATYSEYMVYVLEGDVYARQAITSYLSWDRRTRVIGATGDINTLLACADNDPAVQRLDAIIVDTGLAQGDEMRFRRLVKLVQQAVPGASLICLGRDAMREADFARIAKHLGAAAYLTREAVEAGIAPALHFAMGHHFTITADLGRQGIRGTVLPGRRHYPRLTRRLEQALQLCVVEGLPADLAAQEMGVSTSTVRSYIKEGYRILEAHDDTVFPETISPAERAFLRYTALEQQSVLV